MLPSKAILIIDFIIMQNFLFYLFSIITLISALFVVLSRNAVNSAMFMILAFSGTAGLFFLLEAFFIGVIQILVYAGAVMVLFLFVIMLLNVEKMTTRRPSCFSVLFGSLGFVILLASTVYILHSSPELSTISAPQVSENINFETPFAYTTSSQSFGYGLFTKYMLPIQVAGFLLLTAMIGIVVISKKYKSDTP